MMPLSMINEGATGTVARVGGKEETRRFLENLGFVPGVSVLFPNLEVILLLMLRIQESQLVMIWPIK